MSVVVKLCGLRRPEDVDAAIHAGADELGFIFYPSSQRHVSLTEASLLRALVPSQRRVVAVTVDASDDELDAIAQFLQPDVFQLHGNESPHRVHEVKTRLQRPVIKAIAVKNMQDVHAAERYEESADYLLFDTKHSSGASGGTGITFDWQLLHGFSSSLPWYVSGGLDADNVSEALRITAARRVDASSRLEVAPGVKDAAKLSAFVLAAKAAPAHP
ncbi:MAG: phosphoribosylanthranilate isomerase [Rickettsiales bacterium]|nr:phosphoribosylanthranilate isomerase [Rickettsiales bacterium]